MGTSGKLYLLTVGKIFLFLFFSNVKLYKESRHIINFENGVCRSLSEAGGKTLQSNLLHEL
jgi:hypothetical protein